MATASTLKAPASSRARRESSSALPIAKTGYWLSGSLAVVAAIAAAGTALVPGVLRGAAVMNGSARGTALVVLLIAVPALAIAMWYAAVSYTHLRAHETRHDLVCRLLLE